jgi:hypothetical protein
MTVTNPITGTISSATTSSYLKSPLTSGLVEIKGMSDMTVRTKTVRDANDTFLELGGNYTPTGTWTWTSSTNVFGNLRVNSHRYIAFGNSADSARIWNYNGSLQYWSLTYHDFRDMSGVSQLNTNSAGVNIPVTKTYQIGGVSVNHVQAVTITNATPDTGTIDGQLGINATFTAADATTITFTNLIEGQSGNIRVTCAATAYHLVFAHGTATIKVSPAIYHASATVETTAGAGAIDVYSWWYDGTNIFINGTKGYQ